MSEELLTVSEAAQKLGVSARTVQRYCKQGLLNHKWIHGKRHRELRVVPPIPVSLLPGVKQGSMTAPENMVSRKDFDDLRAFLTRALGERDRRIEELERKLSNFSRGEVSPSARPDSYRLDRLETIVEEYERVRPVEKRLILKLAQTVREHGEFLRVLGLQQTPGQSEE